MSRRAPRLGSSLPIHLALVVCAAIVVLPVAWTIAAGFRTQISLLMGQIVVHTGLRSISRRCLFSEDLGFPAQLPQLDHRRHA